MSLTGQTKLTFIVVAIVVTVVMLFSVLTFYNTEEAFKLRGNDIARVTLRNFSPNAMVNYRMILNGHVVEEHDVSTNKQGVLSIPINKNVIAKSAGDSAIKYEIDIAKPKSLIEDTTSAKLQNDEATIDSGKMLSLLLSLNPKKGKIDISVNGLKEFADIALEKTGSDIQQLKADWSGMFATTLGIDSNSANNYGEVQIAFQNAGVKNDFLNNQMGMPVIEVFALTGALLGSAERDKETEHWSSPIAEMTQQFSAVMVQQTEIIGMMIDANIQMKTQRKIQELKARANKDYHPSEQMCRIGSYIRSVAHSESKAEVEKAALNKYLINQYTGVLNTAASGGPVVYEAAKIKDYIDHYCDVADNNSAVSAICDSDKEAKQLQRQDKDIDYTRAVDTKLTLDIDFADNALQNDEADILALARYLYFPSAFNVPKKGSLAKDLRPHYASRSYAAKMTVAHDSFINIIGMKSAAPELNSTDTDATSKNSGWAHMKAMLRDDFGIEETDVDKMFGKRPSYYAQMEVLTKKIYQNPNFYTNLYDKPANVKRIGAALDAILLMNQRDRFESLLRREMLSATLIENTLTDKVSEINSGMLEEMHRSQLEQ